jgi:hypothetical protein
VTNAIDDETGPSRAVAVAQTLISASIGLKHQVQTREAYLRRLGTAVELLVDR